MTATATAAAADLADLVASGTVVGSAPGAGPDGVYLVLWDGGDGRRFTAWETFDGTNWEPLLQAVSCQPVSLAQAALVAQHLLHALGEPEDGQTIELVLPAEVTG